MMVKSTKIFVAAVTAVAMTASMAALTACNNTKEEPKIGYYTGDTAGLTNFFHFYEDGTYYSVFYNGSLKDAGTYEIKEEQKDYYAEYIAGEEKGSFTPVETSKQTADYVFKLTSYGGTTQEIAWDDGKLCDFDTSMSHHLTYSYAADYTDPTGLEETSAYAIELFYYNNQSGLTLALNHNKTFLDMTLPGEDSYAGTWTKNESVYTLTTDDNKTFTLTVANDGTATYKRSDTDTIALADKLKIAHVFTATVAAKPADAAADYAHPFVFSDADNMTAAANNCSADFKLVCDPENKTYTLSMSVTSGYGQSLLKNKILQTGTYTETPDAAADGKAPKLEFTPSGEGATPVTAVGAETNVIDVHNATRDYTLTLSGEATVNIAVGQNSFNANLTYSNIVLTYTLAFTM